MSWKSGTSVLLPIIKSIKKYVNHEDIKYNLYMSVIQSFESADWDSACDVIGVDPILDKVIDDLHPDWYKDWYEDEEENN